MGIGADANAALSAGLVAIMSRTQKRGFAALFVARRGGSREMNRMDKALSSVLNKDPKMIRFYALRMIMELSLGRRLSKNQQQKLFSNCRVGILESEK